MTLFATRRLKFGTIIRKPQIILFIFALSFSAFATDAPGAQVTLAWDAVTDSGIVGYRMHYGASSGNYSASIDAGLSTTCTVPDLTSGTTYYFTVTAYTSEGDESGYSNEVSYTIPADTVPPAVSLSSITISGATQVNENSSTQFTCTAHYSDGSSEALTTGVSWSDNTAAAAINSSGLLTAGSVNADTAVTITATYGGRFATHPLTIKNLPPTLVSIAISGPIQVSENSSAQYACTAHYSDGSSAVLSSGVSWSENAAAATITSNGRLTTGNITSDTSVTVTAAYNGLTDTHSVTIKKSAATLASLSISGPSRLDEESSGNYVCTAGYSDNSTSTVTDSVQWNVNSEFAAINATGHLVTRAVKNEQHVTITATFDGKQAGYDLIISDSKTNYTLEVDILGSGTVQLNPPGGVYDSGTVVTLTALADQAWAFDGWMGSVADPEAVTTTVIMDSDLSVSATFLEDTDLDSVPDQEEWGSDSQDMNFDGNADGIADYLQDSVTSLHTKKNRHFITVSTKAPGRIKKCRSIETDRLSDAPSDAAMPLGLLDIRIDDLPPSTGTTLTLHLPAGSEFDTFYKYGPTAEDASDHWYEFMYDEDSETGAVIDNDTVTIFLKDGSRGDDDLTVNGVIIDPGGPAILGADPTPPGSQLSDDNPAGTASSGGSSGCFIDTFFTSPR
jgi:hypothetical protein